MSLFMSTSRGIGRFFSAIGAAIMKIVDALKIRKFLFWALVIVAIVGSAGSVYFYKQYSALKANPDAQAQKESAALIAALGKHIVLPSDETPSVVTIVDKSKLSDQPFFKSAENGDILFAYINTKEAILYRPSADRIVQVASINVSAPADATVSNDTKAETVSVAYENGTATAGLSAAAEKTVNDTYANFTTSVVTTAVKTDYTSTIVVDISGKHAKEAAEIAKLLGGSVSALPEGEVAPNADLLVISGK